MICAAEEHFPGALGYKLQLVLGGSLSLSPTQESEFSNLITMVILN